MYIKNGCTLFFTLLFFSLQAQSFDAARMDQFMESLVKNDQFMGSISLTVDNKPIYAKAFGYADIQNKVLSTPNTKYRVGSITKTFTTALVFKAVEEKKIQLSSTLNEYFPSIKNAPSITISQLLHHRSGIHNFTDDDDYLSWNTQPITEKGLLAIIEKGGSDFEPDSKAEYSNSNFVLLTFILERAYQKTYKELVQEKIILPLGLKKTYYGGSIQIKNEECYSYTDNNGWEKESETDMSVPLGAGAIVANPSDLCVFMTALFAEKIISKSSLDQMKTIREGYGMGLFEMPFNGKKGYGHTGGIDGFVSMLAYFPSEKLAFAITSNGSKYDNNSIAIATLKLYFGQPIEIPDFKVSTYKPENLDIYLGVYSSPDIPLKITVTKNKETLVAQATGQSSFDLSPKEKDVFTFDKAGINMSFDPAKKQMTLQQGGGVYTFTKD